MSIIDLLVCTTSRVGWNPGEVVTCRQIVRVYNVYTTRSNHDYLLFGRKISRRAKGNGIMANKQVKGLGWAWVWQTLNYSAAHSRHIDTLNKENSHMARSMSRNERDKAFLFGSTSSQHHHLSLVRQPFPRRQHVSPYYSRA